LILDDIPENTYIMKELLSRQQAIVHAFNDGSQALLEFEQNQCIDIVITDLRMPGMSGQKFIAEIRKINKSIPVLVVTAETDPSVRVECINTLNVNGFLQKPIILKEFLKTLCQVLCPSKKSKEVTLLLVDDEAVSMHFLNAILTDKGCNVLEADSVQAVLN
jgi:two-component system response regulator PilR (NtrC family)